MGLENLMWSLKSPRKMVAIFCMNPVCSLSIKYIIKKKLLIPCLPMKHLGVHMNSFKRIHGFQIELEFGSAGFWGEGKTGVHVEKPVRARERTNNKLNPHTIWHRRQESNPGHLGALGGEHSHHCTIPCSPKSLTPTVVGLCCQFVRLQNAWENSQHLVMPPLVYQQNDVWGMSAEIPY